MPPRSVGRVKEHVVTRGTHTDMQRFLEPSESVGIIKAAAALALCVLALGVALGLLLGVSPVEPLLDFSAVDASTTRVRCTRAHWQLLETSDSDFWRPEACSSPTAPPPHRPTAPPPTALLSHVHALATGVARDERAGGDAQGGRAL